MSRRERKMEGFAPGRGGAVLALCLWAVFLLVPASARGQGVFDLWKASREAAAGNRSYHEGRYDAARSSYQRAADQAPGGEAALRLHFNAGAAYYKEGDYESAEAEFKQALSANDPRLREQVHYNLGNVYFQQALQNQDLELLKRAVAEYQAALELNPDNKNAKFNIEVARRLIGKLLDEQKKQAGEQCPRQQAAEQKADQDEQAGDSAQERKESEQGEMKPEPRPSDSDQAEGGQADEEPEAVPAQLAELLDGSTVAPEGDEQEETLPDRDDQDREDDADEDQPETETLAEVEPRRSEQEKPAGSDRAREQMTEEEALLLLRAVEQREQENLQELFKLMRERRARKDRDW